MSKTKTITLAGVTAALVFAATFFIRIPSPVGYVNAGDAVILIMAGFLGGAPLAAAAAVGSALADIIGGYAIYAPATTIIKGLMGLLAGAALFGKPRSVRRTLLIGVLCNAIMVGGYFLNDWILYGFETAVTAIVTNGAQALAALVAAVAVAALLRKRN